MLHINRRCGANRATNCGKWSLWALFSGCQFTCFRRDEKGGWNKNHNFPAHLIYIAAVTIGFDTIVADRFSPCPTMNEPYFRLKSRRWWSGGRFVRHSFFLVRFRFLDRRAEPAIWADKSPIHRRSGRCKTRNSSDTIPVRCTSQEAVGDAFGPF